MNFQYLKQSQITLLNLEKQNVPLELRGHIVSVVGNAVDMPQYKKGEFALCFSNSVIEHLGTKENQQKMAAEMKRVGKFGYLQTLNKYFPIEPHFVFPFFQFLPHAITEFLVMHFNFMYVGRIARTKEEAHSIVTEIRLIGKKNYRHYFPKGISTKKRFSG